MNTVTPPRSQPTPLQTLAAKLQAALQPLMQVRCGYKQETLLVLAEHAPSPAEPTEPFARLRQAIEADKASVFAAIAPSAQSLPVRLYLRLAGAPQPYAMQEFTLAAAGAIVPVTSAIVPIKTSALELSEHDLEPTQTQEAWFESAPPLPAAVWGLGVLVALTTFVGTVYALTRPCVLSECVPLQRAEQLSRTAAQTVETTTSAQAVVDAYDQLLEATDLLSTIPPWSRQHDLARSRLQTTQAQADELRHIVSALHQAQSAALKSQNPPHPFREWLEIRTEWQQAIARVQQVPANSPVATLAQRKLGEYQANLTQINRRIDLEREAQAQVSNARATARIAEAREGVATSLDSWQIVQATWQSVVALLQRVPPTTMAQAEAQQLLAIYQPKFAAARDRATREGISNRLYNDALNLARQAESAERDRQWSQAVEQWQQALTNVQQVPPSTIYHDQAQPLVSAYSTSLARAQEMRTVTNAQQAAADDLSRICAGTPKVCDYSFADKVIRVRITSTYDRVVEQTMTATRMSGDYTTQAEVMAHVNSLLRALAAISENADLPIELYNSDGSLFGTYKPEFSGYVPR